jgi:sugar phosphate permease
VWPARVFYGWRMVAAGFTVEVLIGALLFHAYGSYVVLLREEYGWSRTVFSAAFALARSESAVLGPLQGWLTDRFGSRIMIRTGMAVCGVGFLLFSQVRSPGTFFATFFLMAIGAGLGGYLPTTVALVNWFRRRRALALSLSSLGSGVGGLLNPLVVAALTTAGWRVTAIGSGLLIIAVGAAAAQVFRDRPETYGLRPDGDAAPGPEAGGSEAGRPAAAPADFTAREAMRTSAFWLIAAGHGSALLIVSTVLVHTATHVTERLGFSLAHAAQVISLLTLSVIVGQLGGGWAGDRLSKRAIAAGCMLGHAAALYLLALASSFWMVLTFAVLHGLAWGTRGPMMAAIRADYFGTTHFGRISGASSMIAMLGMIIGPLVAGVLADRTGSYRVGFILLGTVALLGSVCFLLARRPPPREAVPVAA